VTHLIVHQRNQWRNDDTQPLAQQRGQLIAQGFTTAGGHDDEGIPGP